MTPCIVWLRDTSKRGKGRAVRQCGLPSVAGSELGLCEVHLLAARGVRGLTVSAKALKEKRRVFIASPH